MCTHLGVLPDAGFTATKMALVPDMMAFAKDLNQAPQGGRVLGLVCLIVQVTVLVEDSGSLNEFDAVR